jgi:sirohydrochlorin cobaltochelatase
MLRVLDRTLKILLPPQYAEDYESVQPVSMGSAGLKFGQDGRVAWDQVWGSFCDLAMAGGPPHKGALLEPGLPEDIAAQPDRYQEVAAEICRGVLLATELSAAVSPIPGWIRVECYSERMAAWLLRAITMENVAVRADGMYLDLPAAPAFRLEKEIKNVITVIAKTCHYWVGHMTRPKKDAIGKLLDELNAASPLIEPLDPSRAGWAGVEMPTVARAVWIMRAMAARNVLARREGLVLYLPVNPLSDPGGVRVSRALAELQSLASARASAE